MTAPVIVTQQVTKMWTERAGLRPLDLMVSAGEVAVVRGRSGTGKSTLLAVLAGWCQPTDGLVLVGDRPPGPCEAWGHIALVPQSPCLARELTLIENVEDALALPRDEATRLATEWLRSLDLSDQAARLPHEVSSGQQQRAAVARASAARPLVLLVDEPTSFQGDHHVTVVLDALRELAMCGTAVVIATHAGEVVDMADQVIDLT